MHSQMQEANVPLDQGQLDWLIKKFDKNCTAMIMYRSVCKSWVYNQQETLSSEYSETFE